MNRWRRTKKKSYKIRNYNKKFRWLKNHPKYSISLTLPNRKGTIQYNRDKIDIWVLLKSWKWFIKNSLERTIGIWHRWTIAGLTALWRVTPLLKMDCLIFIVFDVFPVHQYFIQSILRTFSNALHCSADLIKYCLYWLKPILDALCSFSSR